MMGKKSMICNASYNCTIKKLKCGIVITFVVALLGIMFMFSHIWSSGYWSSESQGQHWVKKMNCSVSNCLHTVSTETFVGIQGCKTLYFNAFLEHRTSFPSVRVLAIVWRAEETPHYCVLYCEDMLFVVSAKKTVHSTHYYFPYGMADFLCTIPGDCKPKHASLTTAGSDYVNSTFISVLNQEPRDSDFPVDITICISTMFNGYNNVLQFIQAMEIYRLLGAQKVVVYKSSCSPDMEEVLCYYQDNMGFVEVLPWLIGAHINVSSHWLISESPGDLHYNGQIPALHDCMYRNMYSSKYVFLHDPDEIILPYLDKNWRDFLERLRAKYGEVIYYFENNVFPVEEFDDSGRYYLKEWASLPGESFLQHTLREPLPMFPPRTGKLIINPRTVFEVNVHLVERSSTSTVKVPPSLGRMYHIRRRKNTALKRNDLIVDEGLWKWAPQMIREVNKALNRMNLSSQKHQMH
ncbi:uncharacterized protein LOC143131094 [Alosa pseudoharengus]|uniref:uncharacterized protein LOC143131094 n=1 Tax=Alosa pseudoharengus TaxID=34774 RepID=UPI003F8A4342